MVKTGRPKAAVVLSDAERDELLRGARAATSTQAYALRCKIILASAEGSTNTETAQRFGISMPTVGKWRTRFLEHRMAGLADEARPGRPASIPTERVEQVLATTLESAPPDAGRWSRASMAQRSGVSKSTVGRIWRRFDLAPHLQDGVELSADLSFTAKVVDVAGLYQNQHAHTLALCVDEKSPPQAHPAPNTPGDPDRATDYQKFLATVDKAVPAALEIHLICDNAAAGRAPSIHQWLARHPRLHLHYMPAGSSWTDEVEFWFSQLPQHELHTRNADPLAWTKPAQDIAGSLTRYMQRTSGAEKEPELPGPEAEVDPRPRRRKAPITPAQVVDTALDVVAAEGYEALTMRRLADALDTGPASLYAHVAGKADLDELLIARLCAQLVLPEPAPAAWRKQIHGSCTQLRDQYLKYPGISRAALAMAPTAHEITRVSEGMLAILLTGGVAPQAAAWAIDALLLYVAAYCLEASVARERAGVDDVEWVHGRDELQRRFTALPAADFPHSTRYAAELTAGASHHRFDFTLGLMIGGLAGR
jgi:AcrR family transcriptional regulator